LLVTTSYKIYLYIFLLCIENVELHYVTNSTRIRQILHQKTPSLYLVESLPGWQCFSAAILKRCYINALDE